MVTANLPRILKRSVVIAGHKTSVSLENEFWEGLKDIAVRDSKSLTNLIEEIDQQRAGRNMSSAIRIYVLRRYDEERQRP